MSKPRQDCAYFNAIINRMHKREALVSRCLTCGYTADPYTWFANDRCTCPECGSPRNERRIARWKFHSYRKLTRLFRLNRSLDERDGYWEVLDHE